MVPYDRLVRAEPVQEVVRDGREVVGEEIGAADPQNHREMDPDILGEHVGVRLRGEGG